MMRLVSVGLLCSSMLAVVPAFANDPLSNDGTPRADPGTVIVGSADFPENQLLAVIYAKALATKNVKVTTKLDIGSREVYIPALRDGSIDLLPEYCGAVLNYLDPHTTVHTPTDVAEALRKTLPQGIVMLTPSGAEDVDVLAVTQGTADKYHLKSIEDLKPVASKMALGAAPEFKTRQEGVVGLKQLYGIEFGSFKPLDVAGPLTLSAILNGQVQAGNLTSTDPAIADNKLVALDDTKNLFAAQNIVPIMAAGKLNDTIKMTLNAISSALTTHDLIVMNGRLAGHDSYDQVANDWLAEHHLN